MNGGDTDTGGAQVNPSTAPINTPGLRPVDAVVPDNDSDADSATTLTISHDDQPSPTLSSLPSTDSVSQPSEPTVRPIIPTPSSVSTSQFTPPAINAAPVSSLGTPSTQPSAPVVPPVGMQQPTATPIISPVPPAQSADQLISQTFASSTSSSQPTIATPVAPLQPSQPTQPLAAPSFSSQPAMQFPAASISSSSDDIILGPPAPSQKSKKNLIIAIVVALVAITVIVLLVIGIQSSSKNKQQYNAKNSREAFNRYANYVINGAESLDPLGEYNLFDIKDTSLHASIYQDNEPEDAVDISYATELFNNFKNSFGDQTESTKIIIDSYYDNLQLLSKIIEEGKVNANTYINSMSSLDQADIQKTIDETYSYYNSITANYADEYAIARKNLDNSIREWLLTDTTGCFDSQNHFTIDTCSSVNSNEFRTVEVNLNQLFNVIGDIEEGIVLNIWSINNILTEELHEK